MMMTMEPPRQFSTDDPKAWRLSRAEITYWFLVVTAATSFVLGLLLGLYWDA